MPRITVDLTLACALRGEPMERKQPRDSLILEQLDRRMTERHEHLVERLAELATQMRALHEMQIARLDAHEAYHRANEHRWGLAVLAARHPFRLATLVLLLACAANPRAAGLASWLARLVEHWIG
jgi:hypothetical protein